MLIPTFALLLTSLPASDNGKGSELFHNCQAAIRIRDKTSTNELMDSSDARSCVSYVDGFTDGIAVFDRKNVCIEEVGFETMVRVYIAYMIKNPKAMEYLQAIGLYGALKEAYPCART